MTPEQKARERIDVMLALCGWEVQDYKKFNPSAGRGIALREVPLKTGPCDYLLLVDRKVVGVIEAKKEGTTLSVVADQSERYASSLPEFLAAGVTGLLPFLYESTGVETFFRDSRDPDPRSRPVFAFHRPETLAEWAGEKDTLRRRLAQMPAAHPLATNGMRDCQIEAITALENSFAESRPRALIHMATGAGKTFTACAFTYRLIKYAGARRVLFLVDRSNLGEQARDEFHAYRTPDTGRLFTELYNVQHLNSPMIDDVCRVTICTIQRLYSILRGEELAEGVDDISGAELAQALGTTRTRDVAYNPVVPIEKFDFIITDECHRSIYNLWRQVLEYFDGFLVGLTATPAPQTIAYFHQNRVAEYNHERAVTDGVNVGYDVYRIRTRVTEAGCKVEKGFLIDHRSKASRAARQAVLADDLDYTPQDLDRSVVVPDQIRTILRTYKEAVFTELFPGRTLLPKTLIFAKDDSHAEDIVHLCREVFGKGNDFCKKITYQARHPTTGKPAKSKELIKEFCLSPTLRVAVTVDMIATGTDIKPLEVLIFLRDVRSRVYFEQMKGRGTRVLTSTDLQSVSGEDARAKTKFIIVDAVGVCESDKTESRPLDRQPTVALKTLLQRVLFPGGRDEDTLTTLAARLARLDRELEPEQRQQIVDASGGHTPATLAGALLRASDPDAIAERATGRPGAEPQEVAPEKYEAARQELISQACLPFDKPALRESLEKLKKETEQALDIYTPDEVLSQGFDAAAKEKAAGLVQSFRDYIQRHHAEITALQIMFSRPYKQRLTEPMLKELEKKLRENHATWTEDRLWDGFAVIAPQKVKGRSQAGRFADLVALVRFALDQQSVLTPFADSVAERFEQ
jgi:type I restriction enzyme R subunit